MITENNSEMAALKNQVFTLLVALIVVSGTLTVYLYRQVTIAHKDIALIQQQSQQLTALLNQSDAVVSPFISKLVAYGQKHPDFVPVLKKYGIAPVAGVPASASVSAVPAASKK